jgi:hypothetical protein
MNFASQNMCKVGRSPVFAHARDPELALSGLEQRGPPHTRENSAFALKFTK